MAQFYEIQHKKEILQIEKNHSVKDKAVANKGKRAIPSNTKAESQRSCLKSRDVGQLLPFLFGDWRSILCIPKNSIAVSPKIRPEDLPLQLHQLKT